MSTTVPGSTVPDGVAAALHTVRDPELDEPIDDLGFVVEASLAGGHALVRLRLPTYFCAPNFAYLMVADAHDAVSAVPDVHSVSVVLEDHVTSAEINAGVAAGAGFAESFPGKASGELDELRLTFRRKAHTACLERACRQLLADGWTVEGLTQAHVRDLPPGERRSSLLRRRADLGLPSAADAPVFVDDAGAPVPIEAAARRLRFAQTVRVSIDGNSHFCRGLLTTRYPEAAADQQPHTREQETHA